MLCRLTLEFVCFVECNLILYEVKKCYCNVYSSSLAGQELRTSTFPEDLMDRASVQKLTSFYTADRVKDLCTCNCYMEE